MRKRKLGFREGHAQLTRGSQDWGPGLPDLTPAPAIPPTELVITQPCAGRRALCRRTPSSLSPSSWPQSGLFSFDSPPAPAPWLLQPEPSSHGARGHRIWPCPAPACCGHSAGHLAPWIEKSVSPALVSAFYTLNGLSPVSTQLRDV